MKRNSILCAFSTLALLFASSCMENTNLYNPEKVNARIAASFDFSTTMSCPVDMAVGYKTLVRVYAEDPSANPGAKEIYAAYTQKDGSYTGKMVIPSEYIGKTLYATTFDKCMPAVVSKDGVHFSEAQSRVVTPSSGETQQAMCNRLRDEYMNLLRENTDNTEKVQKNDIYVNIPIIKDDTELTAAFVYSGASIGSKLYYYYYKTETNGEFGDHNNACTNIYNRFSDERYHIFKERKDRGEIWNAWSDPRNEKGYYCVGTTQDLLFYGENYDQEGTSKFPAGYTVSFFLKTVGKDWRALYSEYWLNSWNDNGNWKHNIRQAGLFKDRESQSVIIGFEDLPLYLYEDNKYTCDKDYNDALFAITTTSLDNINDDNIPDLKPEPACESTEGTLLYEDLYPSEGDYDMNDVIIEYTWKKFFDTDNKLEKIECEFTPVHDGAQYTSDFSLMIDGCVTHPIQVFSNHKECLNQTVTITITDGVAGRNKDEVDWNAFNPFITIGETNREVHLTKKQSSANANTDGLDEFLKNYISKKGNSDYPFAMNLPVKGFRPVTECSRIDEDYPAYKGWVESEGKENKDWYNK